MNEKMTALVKEAPGPGLSLKEVSVPRPGPTDIVVLVKRAAICGSDIQCYVWSKWAAKIFRQFPLVLGHEFAGEVVEVGQQVRRFKPGDRVSGETHIPCGNCFQCLTGEQHICQEMGVLGHTVNGCFAQYCILPECATRRLPEQLSYDDAALLEPLGVAVRPCVDGGSVTGESVVVLGCGAIGLMAIGAFRASGAFPIVGIDPIEKRRVLASTMGADKTLSPEEDDLTAAVLELTHGDGAGLIVDASGSTEAIETSLTYLRKGGRYFLIGMAKNPLQVDIAEDLIFKEIKLFGVHGRKMFASWRIAESLLLGGRIDLKPIVGKRLPLESFEEGFRLLTGGEVCKVLFEVSD